MGFMNWRTKSAEVLQQGGVIGPDERLPWPQTAVMGVQHVIAMFGATVLAPILMGFDPNVAILMSGVGTLIFFLVTGGKVPSYLGSSFAFIGVVIAATGYAGQGPMPTSAWRWAASLRVAWSTRSSARWCRPLARAGSSASCRPWSRARWWR
jgi:Xanthine/uracil permeases